MPLGVVVGWLIIQVCSAPVSSSLKHLVLPPLENVVEDHGVFLSISLLLMIGMWILLCITAGYVAGMVAGHRVVFTALIVGMVSAFWIVVPITPQPMLFTYQYLMPATVIYASVIGGALVLSSDKVVDD